MMDNGIIDERSSTPAGFAATIDSEEKFSENYNLRSFMFGHDLPESEVFNRKSLIEVAVRQGDRPGFGYCSSGAVSVSDRWEKGVARGRTLADTLAGIEHNDSLVMLKHVEQDPVLGPAVTVLLSRMVELAGARMRDDVIVGRATILIASPRRITAYHIDADTNFLFQIAGDKIFRVFDQTDRTLVTDNELENFYAGDANGAVFKDARQGDAITYDFRGGCGVHIPSMAPHWAQNGDSVSVALSLNYDLRSVRKSGRVYAMNRRLRNFGLDPVPPGRSVWRDQMKLTTANAAAMLRQVSGRSQSPQVLGWIPPATGARSRL
ncbi:MAG TPA: hypothetical protein VIZ17_20270 [Acetobacteraceae bacterium]